MISVENLAKETIDQLVACGAFTIEELTHEAQAAIWNPIYDGMTGNVIGGTWSKSTLPVKTQVLKPTSYNPLSTGTKRSKTGSSGGGGGSKGGGGGGGGSTKVSKKTQGQLRKQCQ